MRTPSPNHEPREFAAERWILEFDARSAIVHAPPMIVEAALVGSTVRVDGCEYRCIAAKRSPGGPVSGTRLRLFVESL